MKRGPRSDRSGVILVNVLFVVAIAATVVMLMITAQDVAIDRTKRLREATQAIVHARSGELSAIVALRRDAVDSPASDHLREPWTQVEDEDVAIEGGRFSLRLEDQQSRFNINNLKTGSGAAVASLSAILTAAGLPPDLLAPIVTYVRFAGPIADVKELALLGLDPAALAGLSVFMTALPQDTAVNVNTADERLLAVLFEDPDAARQLVAIRDRRGFLTPEDVAGAGAALPLGAGFRSDFYRVQTDVTVGDTRQTLISALKRTPSVEGAVVHVYARDRTAAAPVEAPPRG